MELEFLLVWPINHKFIIWIYFKIKRNEIKYNEYGIKCISSNPYIFCNKIYENKKDGIITSTYKDFC